MKKIIMILAASALAASAMAQNNVQQVAAEAAAALAEAPENTAPAPKPVYWTKSAMTQLNFVQSSFTNWAKGGNNNIAVSSYIDAQANYAKDEIVWKNRLQLDYGLLYSEDKPIIQKNKDRILFESTFGYKATKHMNYSATFTFLNQFTSGYVYGTPSKPAGADDDWSPSKSDWRAARILKSALFSPANITLGLGIDWVPNEWLTVNFAPLTGGFTIVGNEKLRANYGMDLKSGHDASEAVKDDKGLLVNGYIYRAARFEFGAQLKAEGKIKVNDNFEGATQLILFSNYLDKPGNIRVNWDNRLMWKVAKYFSLNLTTSLIYDDKVLIVDDSHPAGHKAIQFNEALQFGFTYTFTSK